jgi:alpha-glucosidase
MPWSTAEEQQRDPHSMWSFYRAALAQRRTHPAFAGTAFEWLDSPEHTLLFRRDTLHCAVNTGTTEVEVAVPGGRTLLLPPDTTVWSLS